MARYVLEVEEMVKHRHRLVIECRDIEYARLLADTIDDEELEHPDDITTMAERHGANVVSFERDHYIDTDYIECDDVYALEED